MNVEIIKQFENKRIRLKLVSGYFYETSDLNVLDEQTLEFNDKYGNRLVVSVSEIASIMLIGGDNGKK